MKHQLKGLTHSVFQVAIHPPRCWSTSIFPALLLATLLSSGTACGAVHAGEDVIQPQPLVALGFGDTQAFAAEISSDLGMGAAQGPRNPFAPSAKLLMLKDQPAAVASITANADFTPAKQPEKIPKMRLRGHLQGQNGEVVALLELIGGDVYIVREGDTVGLHDFGIDSVVRVQKISRLHLEVESGSMNQRIIVR